jgi:hypothetical protein
MMRLTEWTGSEWKLVIYLIKSHSISNFKSILNLKSQMSIVPSPGPNVIKRFKAVFYQFSYKAKVFVPWKSFQPCQKRPEPTRVQHLW